MGVTGLWKLIEPCGKPVPVETLEGKVLAIDISIWLHQVVKGFQDNKGSALPNAHLLGLFHRLCKLLYFRVKPIFVFDGSVPQLKRETMARRQQQRSKIYSEAERIQALLLQSLAKEKVVQQALGVNAELLLKSPSKRGALKNTNDEVDDMFKLPEMPAPSKTGSSKKGAPSDSAEESDYNDYSFTCASTDDGMGSSADDSSSFDESAARHGYNTNLQAIDVRSQHFRDLPADVRHEILVDIKETRKQSSWGRLHELPSRGDDFSSFQMKRLLKRRAVQESLEEAEQEMGGRTLTYAELNNFFTEEGILEPKALETGTKQICSDEHTRFLLVRDLKKKLTKTEIAKVEVDESKHIGEQANSSKPNDAAPTSPKAFEESAKKNEPLGKEFDTDLQLAMALSLEETQVYSENDYNYETNENLKLNRDQRKRLENAAIGPARAYMIEYGGMNDDEVEGIMEKTQVPSENEDNLTEEIDEKEVLFVMSSTDMENESQEICLRVSDDSNSEAVELKHSGDIKDKSNINKTPEIRLHVSDDSGSDSDLVEVAESSGNTTMNMAGSLENKRKNSLEIVLDLKDTLTPQDDIFADIFETDSVPTEALKERSIADKSEIESQITISETPDIYTDTFETNTNPTEEPEARTFADKFEIESQITIPETPEVLETMDTIPKSIAVSPESILAQLKMQLENVKSINLDDIKTTSNVIDISDEEGPKEINAAPKTPTKMEIIEICDSDDGVKSPNLTTPSKKHTISEYFQTNYVVKRTPDKPEDIETDETIPEVKSPFFVNKTPKSSRKATSDNENSTSTTPIKREATKAIKSLFSEALIEEKPVGVEDDGVEPLKPTPVNSEELISEAAELLKEKKTEQELETMATDLAAERRNLESERNRQDRMGMSITQRMSTECQELLKLFGIPYIVAPMEAEAQCAFLDSADLTSGTITDDSDIWLFGGRTVYKNFFAQNKHVLEFRAEKIEKAFNCDRKKLIQLACLVGSDYTTGVHGIGAVTALEILASFAPAVTCGSDAAKTNESNLREIINAVLVTLSKFRDWWLAHKSVAAQTGTSARLALSKKLKNIELHEGFPSLAVIEAYLIPKIDDSREAFSWGQPDLESIRDYAKKTFGWTTIKTNEILNPVIKRLEEKKSQATIRNYFTVKSTLSVQQLKVSKRVQKAIDKMSGIIDAETPEKPTKPKAKRTTRAKKKQAIETNDKDSATDMDVEIIEPRSSTNETTEIEGPTTSAEAKKITRKNLAPNIPKSQLTEKIPQREKGKAQMLANKAKAAAILRKEIQADTAAKKKRKS